MRITFIGAGRLATNLGLTLLGAGHEIVSVYSRTMQLAEALAVRYDENVIRHQIQLLREHPFMKDLYERMSLNIHRKANNA